MLRVERSVPRGTQLSLGSGRIVDVEPGRVGGFRSPRAVRDPCDAHGVPVGCGEVPKSGIGRACSVAPATLSDLALASSDPSPGVRSRERAPEWVRDREATVRVAWERPGPCVDPDRIGQLAVGAETHTAEAP